VINSGTDGFAFLLAFTAPMWTLTGCLSILQITHTADAKLIPNIVDDSAAHISEEVSGASWSAPIAIIVGVSGTELLGWGILIAASYATVSVPDLLGSTLPLPMAQLFLDVLGKRGMLAIWSFIIVVQVCCVDSRMRVFYNIANIVCDWCRARCRRISRSFRICAG
jgi:hypothetical protein